MDNANNNSPRARQILNLRACIQQAARWHRAGNSHAGDAYRAKARRWAVDAGLLPPLPDTAGRRPVYVEQVYIDLTREAAYAVMGLLDARGVDFTWHPAGYCARHGHVMGDHACAHAWDQAMQAGALAGDMLDAAPGGKTDVMCVRFERHTQPAADGLRDLLDQLDRAPVGAPDTPPDQRYGTAEAEIARDEAAQTAPKTWYLPWWMDEAAQMAGMAHGAAGYNEARGLDTTAPGPCGHHCYGTDCPCMD